MIIMHIHIHIYIYKVLHISHILPCLSKCNTTVLFKIAMTFDHGKPPHFCDDPVCPDPVWKLSIHKSRLWISTVLTQT